PGSVSAIDDVLRHVDSSLPHRFEAGGTIVTRQGAAGTSSALPDCGHAASQNGATSGHVHSASQFAASVLSIPSSRVMLMREYSSTGRTRTYPYWVVHRAGSSTQ